MIYVAKIENGLVAQVTVEADGLAAPEGWAVVGPENAVGIGWSYADGQFIPPPPMDEEGSEASGTH
ncbi:hypothetical protein [Paracoccus simplex]|uniref:Uncharacterized protein n=1 Tax=Paracoccus simplex TaxID=2086346 RepID=A0ABV7RU60_9RHOB